MDLDEIKDLIDLMDEASLAEIEIEDNGKRIRLRKKEPFDQERMILSPTSEVPKESEIPIASETLTRKEKEATAGHQIISPIVGTFYKSASPTSNPYVEIGDQVKKGQVLCIVEAMKLMNEIESDLDGRVVKMHVDDGTAVDYGEPLFTIDPA